MDYIRVYGALMGVIMPISTARWLRLIQAAESFQVETDHWRDRIEQRANMVKAGTLTKAEAWNALVMEATVADRYGPARLTVAQERWIFDHNRSRNEYEQRRQEAKRRSAGMKKQTRTRSELDMLRPKTKSMDDQITEAYTAMKREAEELEASDPPLDPNKSPFGED